MNFFTSVHNTLPLMMPENWANEFESLVYGIFRRIPLLEACLSLKYRTTSE